MSPSLSTDGLARLEAAMRALVSPLVFSDIDAWRGEVMRSFCDLLGAETSSFHFPGQARPHLVHGLDDAAGQLMDVYLGPAWGNTGAGPDPMLDLFCRIASERSLEAWDNAYADFVLGGDGGSKRSLFWNEVVVPLHSEDSQSLFVATPRGAVQLSAYALRQAPGPGEHVPLLRVLLPTLKAGLDALFRLDAHRAALDVVAEPLVLFDADGVERHRNPAARLLAADPEAARVDVTLGELARRVRPLAFARRGEVSGLVPVMTEVRTSRARYVLRATLLPPGALDHSDTFLISVAADGGTPTLPTADEVRVRHGLSKREAEIALLVAKGLSNEEIAERLFVSRHTVRHHVEAVMAKLELTGRGRGTVAARLLTGESAN